MKKIYNKNARENQLLEEAYGAIYERRNPDAGEYGPHGQGEEPAEVVALTPGDEEEEGATGIKHILDDIWDVMEDDSSDNWWEKLDDIVRRYADQEFWNRKQEDIGAEPTLLPGQQF